MHLINFASAFVLLGLVQAAPTIQPRADFDCPSGAPFIMDDDPNSFWFNVCTGYDSSWNAACWRSPGVPDISGVNYRPCTDPHFHI
ncbi:hypothetical protein GQ44DRAFT_780360 [Phaeosphaeriaceae sp. PMI808]|nr:hypothetical protein GQ44DRAFT_780360 [Phaeosphaeriaceae sp. PMI808]